MVIEERKLFILYWRSFIYSQRLDFLKEHKIKFILFGYPDCLNSSTIEYKRLKLLSEYFFFKALLLKEELKCKK